MEISPRLFATPLGTVFYLYRGQVQTGSLDWESWHVAIKTLDGQIYLTDQAIPTQAQRPPGVLDAMALTRLVHEEPLLFTRD
ncbi:hypothetical protein [Candidatus Cyanaurora vandensis]|uniref:hypothetical protein n=1 Tax=Candidatus Cyanaurora vandensis TaxID=2714958 RepID=UPI00257DE1DF|nr:hypothetical protein [Candidatus Cyanaurora vandensis]